MPDDYQNEWKIKRTVRQALRQTDRRAAKLENTHTDRVWIAAVSSSILFIVFVFIQEGEFDTPLLESFRNGDSAPDSTRFGFFKVICKINLKPLNSK